MAQLSGQSVQLSMKHTANFSGTAICSVYENRDPCSGINQSPFPATLRIEPWDLSRAYYFNISS